MYRFVLVPLFFTVPFCNLPLHISTKNIHMSFRISNIVVCTNCTFDKEYLDSLRRKPPNDVIRMASIGYDQRPVTRQCIKDVLMCAEVGTRELKRWSASALRPFFSVLAIFVKALVFSKRFKLFSCQCKRCVKFLLNNSGKNVFGRLYFFFIGFVYVVYYDFSYYCYAKNFAL
jgi:hypothetical protein